MTIMSKYYILNKINYFLMIFKDNHNKYVPNLFITLNLSFIANGLGKVSPD